MKMKVETYLDETIYSVHPEDYKNLCKKLLDEGFDFPRCLSGADMEYGLRIDLHLQNHKTKAKATVRTEITYEKPNLPTVSDLWGGVEWHEREAYDLVGIHFDDHPDLRRILTEDDWTIHPLQRRYNTKGYLIPDWTQKPWPEVSIWEEPKPIEPEVVQTTEATTTDSVEDAEKVRKPPKRWEPKKPEEG